MVKSKTIVKSNRIERFPQKTYGRRPRYLGRDFYQARSLFGICRQLLYRLSADRRAAAGTYGPTHFITSGA